MSSSAAIYTISTLFCSIVGVLTIRLWLLKKENNLLSEQLTQTSIALEQSRQAMQQLQDQKADQTGFTEDLRNAGLATRLQKPRLDPLFQSAATAAPAKYGFIHSLLEREMPVQEIASILAISLQEANQLVALSKLAKQHE